MMPLHVDHTAPFSDILLEVWSRHELIWRLRMLALTEKRISTRERVGSGGMVFALLHMNQQTAFDAGYCLLDAYMRRRASGGLESSACVGRSSTPLSCCHA
jgi:hypothetical protein